MKKYNAELNDFVFIITISNNQGSGAKKLLDKIDKYSLNDSIVNIGPVKQEDLAWLYKQSYALFLPTLLESFSGTYLESMKFNIPILTSNFDFAREVCNNAALYFDPININDIKTKILSLSQQRPFLIEYGKIRYNSFNSNWDLISKQILSRLTELKQ